MKDLERILAFIIEVEKLKGVQRKTRPIGFERYENSAEHSWHACLAALIMRDYANEAIDSERVIKMLLIHDIGEIDAGDTIIYDQDEYGVSEAELHGAKRVFDILPKKQAADYLELWKEYESGSTAEAQFARAIDRMIPLLQNLHGNGHSWSENNIPKESVITVNSRIARGSRKIWTVLEEQLQDAADRGILK